MTNNDNPVLFTELYRTKSFPINIPLSGCIMKPTVKLYHYQFLGVIVRLIL